MQVARTAYPLNAFEAAKFMLRTRTTLAPSASARTVTRSPHSPSRRGISAPRRCCSHRSETSSHERGLRRSKPAAIGTRSPSRAPAQRRRSADFGSLASRPGGENRAGERVPPFSRTYAQGGCRLNGKWPLTGFLAGESPNQTWGAMLTDLNGLKAVGLFLPIFGETCSGERGL